MYDITYLWCFWNVKHILYSILCSVTKLKSNIRIYYFHTRSNVKLCWVNGGTDTELRCHVTSMVTSQDARQPELAFIMVTRHTA